MPFLSKLNVRHIRNIESISLKPSPGFNILHGANGSGKTSILEGIYLLGMARSFRGSQLKPLIRHGKDECTVYGELGQGVALGITKQYHGSQSIRIAGKTADNAAELAWQLPLQLLNADTFKILEGSPSVRRRFMDWGVFHVEQRFFSCWRQTQRALRHRNALLRKKASREELRPWDLEFIRNAEQVDRYRAAYLEALLPVALEILAQLIDIGSLSMEYERGWHRDEPLEGVLAASLERDYRYGHTGHGPQRGDIRIRTGSNNAVDVLSRGQQKLLVSALKLAQGLLLQRETDKRCLYLVDDLPSELDRLNRAKICHVLSGLGHQVFITCVEEEALEGCWPEGGERKLFHVKHGKID